MDYWLVDQHASILNQQRGIHQIGYLADLKSSWVMLSRSGLFEPLPDETPQLKTRGRISLSITAEKQVPGSRPWSLKCDNGTAYITSHRIIYLPSQPTDSFQSFSSRILDLEDSRTPTGSHMWGFGAWYWEAEFRPVPGGNIPTDVMRAKVQLTFNESGVSDWQAKYTDIRSRIQHLAQIGQLQNMHGEQLPSYSPAADGDMSSRQPESATEEVARRADDAAQQRREDQGVPDEAPPGYDEAQAQAITERFDAREREDNERQ
ncbi:uncharacterized protein B0I36DRAFT_365024 [Microdochium trichocladiopsis]|uniref:Uncharacterized protein n=1 Tax=Microdochium trichocladiopsis TaxID=1682393 RepID=A0A9P8Y2Y2_9PEZI|nr:uncharacterized protein B0I36DRAFT_365024 [Microdochium trichocladiopsis]KAH7027889.1 hypothetical protein B0I36DRAFT_365024 [Microdochium trichocladiopsis]